MRKHLSLLRYLWPHWKGLTVVLATMAVGVGVSLLQPWPMKILIDQVLGGKPIPPSIAHALDHLPGPPGVHGLLLWLVVATVLLFVVGTLNSMASEYALVGLGQRMTYDLAADVLRHLQRLSLLFHNRQQAGDSISRVNGDPYCIQMLVNDALLPLIQSVVMVVAMFYIMWKLQPQMALLSLLVVPFLTLTIRFFGRPMKRRNRIRRDLEVQMVSLVQQSLTAIPAVQAFNRDEADHQRFQSYASETVRAYQRATHASMWFKLFVGLVTAVGTAGIMWLGGTYALEGRISAGTILVFLAYLGSMYGPLNTIAYTASTIQYAAAQADRVLEVLDTPIDVEDRPGARDLAIRGAVRYEHVSFGYEPGRPVLTDVSVEASPGEVTAIVGPTGAGKSTLVSLLVRFFDPWEGRVLVDGVDLRDVRLRTLRDQVAIVLQDPFIFSMTAADNIAYGRPDASREQVVAAARAANADRFIARLPDGYDTVIGERGATLSGGEKQRLSIARAFLKDAPVLILDEPTSALDAATEGMLLDALRRLMAGRVTFIIAHRLSTIRHADQILVIDGGEIVERGSHDVLMTGDGLYSRLYRQQMNIVRHDVPGAVVPALATDANGGAFTGKEHVG